MTAAVRLRARPLLRVPGDWNALFGFGTNILVNVLVLTGFGVVALLSAIIPVVAILPILLYIGMLIGLQAFQESPHRHAPAIVLALVPQVAAWGKTQIDDALGAAGTSAAILGDDKLAQVGVLYKGQETLGGGATLAGIVLGVHGEGIGLARSPAVAVAYLAVAAVLFSCSRAAVVAPLTAAQPHDEGHHGDTAPAAT